MKLLVMDAGGSGIKHAVIDEDMNLTEPGTRKNDFADTEGFLDAVREIVDGTQAAFDGIAMSHCGKMDPATGVLTNPGYYKYLYGVNLIRRIQERTGYRVEIESDGNCAALAEMEYGSLRDYKNACALAIGTGLGLAIIQDRRIWHGAHFNAGLASFMVSGCREEPKRENMIFRQTGCGYLTGRYAECKGLPAEKVDGRSFFEAFSCGDEDAARILKTFCHNVAYVIYNLQVVLDVEAFAIGGGISAQPALIEGIRRELDAIFDGIGIPLPRPQIAACKFFNESNLIGAWCHYRSMRR